MTRAELLKLFDEIVAILESDESPADKLASIEALMFEPDELETESEEEELEDPTES
jgi:hypothetical protein